MSEKNKNKELDNTDFEDVNNISVNSSDVLAKLSKQKLFVQIAFLMLFLVFASVSNIAESNELLKQDYIGGNVILIGTDSGSPEGDTVITNPWRNASMVDCLLFQSLLTVDSSFTHISGGLAESYQILEDGVTYELTMREDQYWSDGEQITAQDVVFSIEGFLSCSNTNSTIAAAFKRIVGDEEFVEGSADSIEGLSTEGNKVYIELDSPYSNFALILTQFVVLPQHILEGEDMETITTGHEFFSNTNTIASGEFYPSEIDDKNYIVLKKNPHYTRGYGDIDTVILCWDYNNEVIDYYSTTDPTKMVSFRSMKGYEEYPVEVYFYRYFIFNLAGGDEGEPNEVMEDVRIRQAIYHAIDVEALAKELYFGKTELIYGGSLTLADEMFEYSPEKAKALLEEAGYDFDRTFHICYYSGDTTSRILLERVASYLEAIGLTVELGKYTAAELYAEPTYDMMLKNLSSLNTEDWYSEYLSTNANLSQLLGRDGEFDELVAELTATTDTDEYNKILQELVDLEQDLLYKMPMFLLNDAVYINSNRLSVPEDITFGNTRYRSDIRFDEWFVKKE